MAARYSVLGHEFGVEGPHDPDHIPPRLVDERSGVVGAAEVPDAAAAALGDPADREQDTGSGMLVVDLALGRQPNLLNKHRGDRGAEATVEVPVPPAAMIASTRSVSSVPAAVG